MIQINSHWYMLQDWSILSFKTESLIPGKNSSFWRLNFPLPAGNCCSGMYGFGLQGQKQNAQVNLNHLTKKQDYKGLLKYLRMFFPNLLSPQKLLSYIWKKNKTSGAINESQSKSFSNQTSRRSLRSCCIFFCGAPGFSQSRTTKNGCLLVSSPA